MLTNLSKSQACMLAGAIQLLACLIIFLFNVPNPNIILFVILSAALVQFGYLAGSICGAIAFIYSAFFFSTNNDMLSYIPLNSAKLLVIGIGIILNIFIIGHLQHKWEQANKEKAELEIIRQVNSSKEQLLSSMSHDIRTPINGISGMLQIIKNNLDDKENLNNNLKQIEVAVSQLLALTNDVIDMNYFRYGKVQVDHIPFNLQQTCAEAIAISEKSLHNDNISFSYNFKENCNTQLLGSPYLIRRILLNLYSNAIKYNRPGGFINTELNFLQETKTEAQFQIIVQDNGIGMSKDFVQNHLFEMFAQENPGARSKYCGSGLGMPIVKQLVELLQGTIKVESELNKGTTFTLQFTFDKNLLSQKEPQNEETLANIKGTKILLVEDNKLNMEVASHLLTEAGAVVTKAYNGEEAVKIFRQAPAASFDIILMDIMMPVMDGLTATKVIRQLERAGSSSIPIFAMTANVFPEDVEKSRAAGINEHLAKPIDMHKLLGLIKKYTV